MTYSQRRFAKKHTHRYFVDRETNDAVCLCGKVRSSKKAKKGKYNASHCLYNGSVYDSKFEAQYAMGLDWRLKAKDIKAWDRQSPVKIEINGDHILTTKVDFRVHEKDGRSPSSKQRDLRPQTTGSRRSSLNLSGCANTWIMSTSS